MARVVAGLEPVPGFDWIYEQYRGLSELPEKTVEDELLKLGWGVVSDGFQDMDVVPMRGNYSIAIGTYYQGEILYFPSVFSELRSVGDCAEDVLGVMRE
jgi:hypothetical protein